MALRRQIFILVEASYFYPTIVQIFRNWTCPLTVWPSKETASQRDKRMTDIECVSGDKVYLHKQRSLLYVKETRPRLKRHALGVILLLSMTKNA
jgi:hypothetical protein